MKPRPSWDEDVVKYFTLHPDHTDAQAARAFGMKTYQITNVRMRYGIKRVVEEPPRRKLKEALEADILEQKGDASESTIKKQYDYALREIDKMRREREAILRLKQAPEVSEIKPHHGSGTSEATYFSVASDWHIEERVRAEEVNGLNEYNLEIAYKRSEKFFQKALRLYRMFAQDVKIENWVLPLLGDFITSNIHEELVETAQLAPAEAIWKAQNILISGIDFILNHTKAKLILPCKSGNHGRMTKDQRHATEEGNSLESFMYRTLAQHYEGEPRTNFILSDGYHIYLDVYGQTVRIHHGHAMNYGGGVGGIYIPVNKALAQWNKARKADLDIFGHFHQFRDGGNFVSNGSLIGYNSYALTIKAEYERPQQASFLIDKKRAKTIVAPILPDPR
ncbi:MAG TPA: hypothetical protein VNJ52_04920 [Patescibacteria group bacterium]|nr:hypothetical protein [Patescibacteria group bacterium]